MLSDVMQAMIPMLRQSKEASKGAVYTPEVVLQGRAGVDQMLGAQPTPEDVTVEQTQLGDIEAERYTYMGDDKAQTSRIGLFIHGGGFATGSVASRRYMATTTLHYAKMDGYSIEYRQYPEGHHPDGLMDCVTAFEALQELGHAAEDIVCYGESGGAMLCLQMTMWLKDHGRPLPGGLCVFSPLTNIRDEYESRSSRDERDPMIQGHLNHELDYYFTEEDKASPYVSTALGDYAGFPPVSIHVGTEEVLFDDSVELERRCREVGVDVRIHVWEGLFHSFAIMAAPESEEALAEVGSFLRGDEADEAPDVLSDINAFLERNGFGQTDDGLFTVEKVAEGVTRINVPGAVCVYYLEGSERGLLIDTGYGYGDLKACVDAIATKPYDVALTHGHVDHAGGAVQFDQVFMSLKDIPVAEEHTELSFRTNYINMAGVPDAKPEDMVPMRPLDAYTDLEPGASFELSGLTATFLPLPGHTPGSMVVYIHELSTMFFGDAVNSAAYLQLPESSPLPVYRDALKAFEDEWAEKYERTLYSHPHNFGGPQIIGEMIELADEVIDDPSMGITVPMIPYEGALLAKPIDETLHRLDGKSANLVYMP
ncbi:MAG: alpha/beta hydrolase fold domain-containing protein [Atopobiaceae bacterium]|nr:alpha/beta hydrolase fold domain-containing protein [Atopobiaceae bacterium]MBR3383608.1 alpha/beta hydrolase fold domain-containing protein [Atopobiaceae bacterium]